jgi:hypothetical protein
MMSPTIDHLDIPVPARSTRHPAVPAPVACPHPASDLQHADPCVTPSRDPGGGDRFVVGARLPVTIAVCANTAALARWHAAAGTVAVLQRIPMGFLRGRTPAIHGTRHPHLDSVTATRVLRRVPNPRLPNQPVFTIAATVLLGVVVEAPDRTRAWRHAHDLLHAGVAELRTVHLQAHLEALDISWVRHIASRPSGRHKATHAQPTSGSPNRSGGTGHHCPAA